MMRYFAVTGLLLAAAGCAVAPPPVARYYDLPVVTADAREAAISVTVETVQAAGVYADRPLLFRDGGGPLQQYHYHLWAQQPATLLQDALVDCLRRSLTGAVVYTPQSRARAERTVRVRLRALEQVVGGSGATAVLAAEVSVHGAVTAPPQILDYRGEAAAGNRTPAAYVAATGSLVSELCAVTAAALAQQAPE
jgi:uncharacterized lipoprotein YmbA